MRTILLGAISLVLCQCASPLRREEISPEEQAKGFELAQLAIVSLEKGEVGEARQLARQALDHDPFSYEGLVASGRVALLQDHVGEAESQFGMARDLEPKRVEAYIGLGDAALKINHFDAASGHFGDALKLDPRNPSALHGQARAFSELGRPDDVILILREYLEINPNDAEANLMIGKALLIKHTPSIADAEYYLVQAAKLDPKNADVLNALGVVRIRSGRWDDAAGLFEAALAVDPKRPDLYCNLGMVQEHLMATAMAESQYRRALAIDAAHAASILRLSDLLASTNRRDEALKLLAGADRDPRASRADREAFREKEKALAGH